MPGGKIQLSETPKRVEVLVGGYPQLEYAGVYEREDEMLNGRPIYVQINQMRWCVEHNKPLYNAANKKRVNYVQYVATGSSNDNFVWMIGPERGKPVGAFYSADGNMNPTESKNWYACKYKGFRGSKNSWVPAKKKHFCIQDNDKPMFLNLDVGSPIDSRNGVYELLPSPFNEKAAFIQIKDRNGLPIAAPMQNEDRKENFIYWIKSNASPTKEHPDGQYVWMIGPTAEKKADKPPILRNMGGFYSEDDCLNPAICKNWYAFHENEGKKGFWDDAGPGFKLTHIKQPKHIYLSTGELRRSVRAAFQQQTSYTSPKEFLEARKESLKSKHLMELRKLSAVGLYREHERTLNGKIVYEQILPQDSTEQPYLIQWVSNPCGKYEWIIQRGWDQWNGESICLSNYIFKGRRPNRPLYMTTEEHRWPTKISEFRWKLFDETKRGGSFVKAAWETTEKDIQGNETTIRHGLKFQEIEIPESISIEHATLGGTYTLGSALFNGRYYWRRANEKTGYLHWSQNRDRELVWSLSDKLGQVANCTSYDDAWTPADMINWRLVIGPETKTVNLAVPTRERLLRIEHL